MSKQRAGKAGERPNPEARGQQTAASPSTTERANDRANDDGMAQPHTARDSAREAVEAATSPHPARDIDAIDHIDALKAPRRSRK